MIFCVGWAEEGYFFVAKMGRGPEGFFLLRKKNIVDRQVP